MSIRVLLADDHKMMREGLRVLVENEADLEAVGEADDGRAAVKLASELKPDVVVMDVGMVELDGVAATRQILQGDPNVKVIALSMHSDSHYVKSMLEAGASGYVLKDNAFEHPATGIRKIMAGGIYLCPKIAAALAERGMHGLSRNGKPQ